MRRSMAPSIKRLKLASADDQENRPPGSDISTKVSTLSTVSLGGQFSLPNNISGVSVPGNIITCISTQCISTQRLNQQRAIQQRPMQQFKCPLPYLQSSGGSRGSLGAKKAYGGGLDLLAAIQRQVVLADPRQDHAGPSNAVSELVLYDPEEHKLQWLAQQEAADPASQLEPTPASDSQPPTAPSVPTSAPAPSTAAAAAAPKDDMAWEKRVKVYADPFLVERLRPHQREGVKFVFECLSGVRQQGISGAVLADGMGLGKTFQTIASLYCLLTKGIFGQPTCKKPLILCPTSLVQNWGKELVKWLGDRVEPVVVDDTKADKVKKSLQGFRGFSRTGKARVLVMSYPCFRGHKAEVYKLGIDVLTCDEAHFLKNGEAQITQAVSRLPTQLRLLMSGTPIQNDLSEFHAVFDLACPGLLGNLNTFRKVYEGPIQRGRDADATEKQVDLGRVRMNDLMKLCNRFMLRRTSTVLKELLPTKVEQVVFCKLSKLQLKLYEHFLASRPVKALLASTLDEDGRPRKRKPSKAAATQAAAGQQQQQEARPEAQQQEEEDEEQQPLLAPLAAITALKKLCCHPDLIWDMLHKHKATELKAAQMQQLAALREAQRRVSARASVQAPKGYFGPTGSDSDEDGGDKGKDVKKRASKRAAGSSSGSARQQLSGFEGCAHLFRDGDVYPSYQQGRCQAFHSGKVMVLEALLKSIRASEPGDKVVLVSNYTEALDVLGVMCKSHNWVSLRLDGSCSVKQRQALVDTFNDPQHPSFVLLLSSKAGGVGLNIIGANRLVLFDPDWNPANDLQAMARVWREGQAKRVWIYRLLMAGSIEEKVLQRQLAKQGLSEALVDEVGQEVRTFSRDELRSLFKVDPSTPCDTHCAIKCTCDGSVAAMAGCRERAAALGGGSSSDRADAAEQQGILAWAHLARASDSPDPTWGTMSSWVRDNFVTYLFSDHVLGEQAPPGASARLDATGTSSKAAAAAAAGLAVTGKRHASGTSSSSGSDADESSDAEESEEENAAVPAAGCAGISSQQRSGRGLGSNLKAAAASATALPASSHKGTGVPSTSKDPAGGPGARRTASAAADATPAGDAATNVLPPSVAGAAASSGRDAGAANSRPSTAALPPKPRRASAAAVATTAAAGTVAGAKHTAPVAARRRSAAVVLTHSQAPSAGAEAAAAPSAGKATGNAAAASRRRNSAPACNAGSTSAQAGSRRGTAPKGTSKDTAGAAGSKAAAAGAAPDLSAFAYSGANTGGTKPCGRARADTAAAGLSSRSSMLAAGAAGRGAAGSATAMAAVGGADSSSAPSPPHFALMPGQLDDLVSELCRQRSDPLDDTPMLLGNSDSDSDFM